MSTTKIHYISNKILVQELVRCKKNGVMSRELAEMFLLLVERFSRRGNFNQYSYIDDMRGKAMLDICQKWKQYDVTRANNNAFSYFTELVKNSFVYFITVEKKQTRARDEILIDMGKTPSWGYTDETETTHYVE